MLTPIELIKATVDGMATRGFGRVVNITSGAVAIPVATAGAIAGWAPTEGANVPGPQPFDFAERMLEPDHTLGVHMRITRKALKQAGALKAELIVL